MRTLVALLLLSTPATTAGIVDRIAVIVGTQVITQTQVEEEVRVTQFENQEPLNLGPEARQAAAERLVDQQLLRKEMNLERYRPPAANEGAKLLDQFRRENYPDAGRFAAALKHYCITAQQLENHLLWQAELVSFVDFRFRGPASAESPLKTESASRALPGAAAADAASDAQLDAWLKDARSQTRVEFKKEAFQ
ncbi:MAG TPA: hypothetical protein VKV17_05600 [Bryobacteraceae bacterium]|nr:hypothetical protein [Bryobacteraceae bacterium]